VEKPVLIVDDEKRMTESLRDLLTPLGYAITTANSGAEAIELLRERAFPVVITDLRMQGVGGLDVVRHISENRPKTLVIVITGYASTESAIEAVHYHVFDYIRKPFEFDQIKGVIERAFQKIELDQLREDTAAMITHDIKVPLTSILGFASLLYDKEKQAFHPRAREFTEMIRSSARKILALVDNYLTSARHESESLQLNAMPTHLSPMVEELVETYRSEAERRGMRIECTLDEAPEWVVLDESLIYRALANLLYNAIKYGDAGEPIMLRLRKLSAHETELGKDAVRFEVINLASDLREADLDALFHRFKRAHKHAGVEGSGIGLYVVYAVARAHQGMASAQYLDGSRVSFSITLPLDLESIDGRRGG
jgi:signal transduction histidine kinase